jgi:hypothetical protein
MREALEIYRELGDVKGQASVLWGLSTARIIDHDYATAEVLLREALALYRKAGDSFGIGWALHMLGLLAATLGNAESAAVDLAAAGPGEGVHAAQVTRQSRPLDAPVQPLPHRLEGEL